MENYFERLSLAGKREQERTAFIEGRQDLFETKILRIKPAGNAEKTKTLLISTRDPGSGNALLPVLRELEGDQELQIVVATDGHAQDIIQGNFETEDITPQGKIGALAADSVIDSPDVILMDRSTEIGIETYATATFPELRKILVEDYYLNTIDFLSELTGRGLPLPEKICVLDDIAKELIVKKFPQLEKIIEVTGQPAFDRFAQEDTEQIAHEVREKLNLQPKDKLITFMSAIEELEEIRQLADALKRISTDFYFVFRRHPRDNVSYEVYRKILTDAGIRVVDTDDFSTNDIGAASDIVLTTWSVEGLHGIYRRKPTVHITDRDFNIPENYELPLPPVKLGASVGIEHIREIAQILPQLLDSSSTLNEKLRQKMEEKYPADGKNAKRVADIVRQYL